MRLCKFSDSKYLEMLILESGAMGGEVKSPFFKIGGGGVLP